MDARDQPALPPEKVNLCQYSGLTHLMVALALAMQLLAMGPTNLLAASPESNRFLSPTALAVTKDGKMLFIACATANRVLCLDTASRKIVDSITVPQPPSGLALSPDDSQLFVICAAPESKVCVVDVARRKMVGSIPAGHTALAPVISPDGKTLFVCNQFNNDVSVIDLATQREVRRVAVQREPVAADITKDGKFLLVANQLPTGRADAENVAAVVSVIEVAKGKVVKELHLPNGSIDLKDVRISPDGKYAILTHIIGNFNVATTEVRSGWINVNAMTIIDLNRMELVRTLLLDSRNSGAANPWGIAWSSDNAKVVVTHAGTHEVSVINFPALIAGLTTNPDSVIADLARQPGLDEGLYLLTGARDRVRLPQGDRGPRAVTTIGNTAYVADFFSDTLSVIHLNTPHGQIESISLGPKVQMSAARTGEFYFHDATICLEGWQSCSSCHPGDARADGLNWDLPNDGLGNPKNTKSLLLAHKTPPAMFLGVRTNAEAAVRSGIEFILFTHQPESVAASIDEYLKSLMPVPSPYLVHGKLSKAAEHGKRVFQRVGCAECHPPGLFTDLQKHDVGTRASFDKPTDRFVTPTLVEIWRTAPYLHDGSAATMRDVVTTCNPHDEHGKTSKLSQQDIDDLCEYALSL
jgi:YVTN family beta-propeller protein